MSESIPPLDAGLLARHNASRLDALRDDYGALSRALERRGVAIDAIKARVSKLELATIKRVEHALDLPA